jgi:hypothetical protein
MPATVPPSKNIPSKKLASQLEALRAAECHKIFQEQISTYPE